MRTGRGRRPQRIVHGSAARQQHDPAIGGERTDAGGGQLQAIDTRQHDVTADFVQGADLTHGQQQARRIEATHTILGLEIRSARGLHIGQQRITAVVDRATGKDRDRAGVRLQPTQRNVAFGFDADAGSLAADHVTQQQSIAILDRNGRIGRRGHRRHEVVAGRRQGQGTGARVPSRLARDDECAGLRDATLGAGGAEDAAHGTAAKAQRFGARQRQAPRAVDLPQGQ